MARDCRKYQQFPQPGGWHDQDELELVLMGIVESAEFIYQKQGDWTANEMKFIEWVESDDS